jgi:hypothetical protein
MSRPSFLQRKLIEGSGIFFKPAAIRACEAQSCCGSGEPIKREPGTVSRSWWWRAVIAAQINAGW